MKNKRAEVFEACRVADDAWEGELKRVFGNEFALARGDERSKGENGSRLRDLYDAREKVVAVWNARKDT
jgi:hypothetical protein